MGENDLWFQHTFALDNFQKYLRSQSTYASVLSKNIGVLQNTCLLVLPKDISSYTLTFT